jgi:hypothetical protein
MHGLANFKLTTHSWNKHGESVAFQIERKSKLREYASRKNTNKRSDGSDTVLKQGDWKTKLKLNLIQGHLSADTPWFSTVHWNSNILISVLRIICKQYNIENLVTHPVMIFICFITSPACFDLLANIIGDAKWGNIRNYIIYIDVMFKNVIKFNFVPKFLIVLSLSGTLFTM